LLLRRKKTEPSREQQVAKYLRSVLHTRINNISLYMTALIHRSASEAMADGHSLNDERLEYLGDAVLDTVVAEYLFKKFPFKREGELTEMRSKLVKREQLGQLARRMHLTDLIEILPTAHAKCAGGDAFEALIGALFLDKGYEKTKQIVLHRIFTDFMDIETVLNEESNFKSKILNWAQHQHRKVEFRHDIAEQNRRQRLYRVQLLIDGEVFAEGLEYTVKKAEQIAAERAVSKIPEFHEKENEKQ
jgi:ribonuclease-3